MAIKESFKSSFNRFKENQFLFSELVKRDFKKKYKGTFLGMIWSVLSPLLMLLVMSLVFTNFFGRNVEHYTIYLFCGNIIFSYFSDSTNGGMDALMSNSAIFSKINVPKYLFLFSKNVSSLINFALTVVVFFIFCIVDKITFSFAFLLLIYPIICLMIFNLGIGLILSALFMFFRDIKYLWGIFIQLLMYLSAIFYTVDSFGETMQKMFYLNPIYVYIKYFRTVVLEGSVPSLEMHALCIAYALIAFGIGALIYKKNNHKFLYYV